MQLCDLKMPEVNNCPCCGLENLVVALRTHDQHENIVTILHCTNCCALVPDYPQTHSEMISHQAEFHANYWSDSTREEVAREARKMSQTVYFYKRYLDYFDPGTEVLDLAGGRGLLTKALLDNGYSARGCDASRELVQIGRNYLDLPDHIYTNEDISGFIERYKSSIKQPVGAIFLWHVIEHLEDPIGILDSLKSLLKPDGVIIAQGPLLDKNYIFPEHRFLHSESNIGWISKKLDMKLLFLDSHSEERFASFVLANPGHPCSGLDIFCVSDIHDAIGSLFSTLSNALHLTRMPAN